MNTPHTWNAADCVTKTYYRGIGWYRQSCTVPAELAGRMLYLQFAGVNQVADVWVNGKHVGRHKGGYSRFRFPVTGVLVPGQDNVIAVKVNNAHDPDIAPLSADFSFDGGIYRNVSLHAVDPLQVQMLDLAGPGVYLRQRDVSANSATVTVTTKLWNHHTDARSASVRTVITDATGTVIADQRTAAREMAPGTGADVVQTVTVSRPRLWNGVTDPYLYQANVEVHDATGGADTITDAVTEPLGLRTFKLDPATGFHLNGKPLGLHGVSLHQDLADKGWALSDADRARDFDLIQDLGANTVRMAHYQHDQNDYNLADERGIVVWAEIPLVDTVTASTGFTESTQNQLHELIRQNYNHPSIVFWGIGNEQRKDDTATNTLLGSLADIVMAEDPDRISAYADDSGTWDVGIRRHSQTFGGNQYYGWDDGGSIHDDLGEWADTVHENDPTRPLGLSEYGAGANTAHHALNPSSVDAESQWHPEEYQALFHEAAWQQLATRPFIWGTYVWNMFDFASSWRNEGGQPGINDKGLVTRDRAVRKDAFYFYRANWSTAPTLYITSRRWTRRTDAATELKVYSNADTVSATLNGSSLGGRSSASRIFRWTGVTLQPGPNTVVVTATINGETHTDTVTWSLA